MSTLHRTQVYLEEEQMRQLKLEAEREHLPTAVLIRKAIGRFLKIREKSINWGKDPLTLAIGQIKLNVSDAARKHDHYLYGKKKRG
ncbi:MAG: ribbon-helix-helix protein, CopG family [Candidatus Omnitrophica bacterium]|nr:ribbon-helix-helix protein, CopG family [Candidatus Omnitrophota bacterium]MBU0878036.1 ribbon-helix-helix protein, CopG family [Candidatus Omnitrophota bacterium]MBU0896173.1 ribbon-helix-helix protein, CopG family [Candidatus Omnitrophota bacterium]MBU1134767.1 ribbon-helix-helix protein, CopG family [Candidatus Omnitrophota bacterium]MBU1366911.1 ribbon-helix-helix protein, CopG family [Candidatus Omnitrophota bacterium]